MVCGEDIWRQGRTTGRLASADSVRGNTREIFHVDGGQHIHARTEAFDRETFPCGSEDGVESRVEFTAPVHEAWADDMCSQFGAG